MPNIGQETVQNNLYSLNSCVKSNLAILPSLIIFYCDYCRHQVTKPLWFYEVQIIKIVSVIIKVQQRADVMKNNVSALISSLL